MVDFVLGRLKFVYQGNWATSHAYVVDDIVTYGGRSYVCVSNHTSSSNSSGGFYTDSANWNLINDGMANRGAWSTSTYYKINDITTYGGRMYIATSGHTSNSTPSGGFYSDSSNWQLLNDGFANKSAWATSTYYKINDVVTYGGRVYIATSGHTSSATSSGGFYTDSSHWQLLSDGVANRGSWSISTYYKVNDIVTYGGRTYIATSGHTSSGSVFGGFYTDISNWQLLNDGTQYKGAWGGSFYYKVNDIVQWGSSLYICNTGHTSGVTWESTESNFSLYVGGLEFENSWSNTYHYATGDIVRYGGYQFVATNESTNTLPTDTGYWSVLSTGFTAQGNYNNSTAYKPGDVVQFGGYTYVSKVDTTGNNPSNTSVWDLVSYGQKWNDAWSNSATYNIGDVARYAGSAYVSVVHNNTNNTPDPANTSYWNLVSQGANSVSQLTTTGDLLFLNVAGLDRIPIGTNNQILIANTSGLPSWGEPGISDNCYYVSPNGVDDTSYGRSIQKPFKTIKYACQHVSGTSTIFVKTGTYEEQLPIVVPPNVSVVGEALRTTIVKPKAGNLSDDGINNNENSTMWKLSDGTVLTQMTFSGMTGFVAGSPANDITAATIKGIVLAFNPSSPILTKSPYIVYCSSINSGGVGALIDGSLHVNGNKSMLFHSYTNIQDGGVGIYAKDNGKAEVVSCFTYYCHMGYAVSGGGKIRSLNGNHSYGTYGSVARGYDVTEVSSNGYIYGDMLTLSSNSLNYQVGEQITGGVSGATGIVTNVQPTAGYVYYYRTSGATTFTTNETVTGNISSYVSNTLSSNSVTGQGNFILVVSGLPKAPGIGQSIEFGSGDTSSYIIQNYSGSYVNTSSIISLTLTSQKVVDSSNGTVIRLRNNFSNIRLTGHDFLNIGVGNTSVSGYPNVNTALTIQANETVAVNPGRVYYTSTDQDGNFRVGQYFAVNQATGQATLNASAFNLSGLSSLRLGSIGAQIGALISQFSTDVTLSANSDSNCPTEKAVKTYVDTKFANSPVLSGNVVINGNFYVSGNTVTIGTENATLTDNMIYLNEPAEATITNAVGNGSVVVYTANNGYISGMAISVTGMTPSAYNIAYSDNKTILSANSTAFLVTSTANGTFSVGGTASAKVATNPDIGIVGGYNDGTYHHTGIFRNHSTARWQVFDNYQPEPDLSINIDTSNTTFHLADFQANGIYANSFSGSVGTAITKFSTDNTLAGNSNLFVPTEQAVKGYVDTTDLVILNRAKQFAYFMR